MATPPPVAPDCHSRGPTPSSLLRGIFNCRQWVILTVVARDSDLFDVPAHVAYAIPPVTREVRAANAKIFINTQFNAKQQAFLDFVLEHYVTVGVEELDQSKLTPLLRLKYHNSMADAVADLGRPAEIGKVFSGFQKYLYEAMA